MEDEDGTLWEALHQAHSSVINEFKRKFQPANTTASLLDDLKAFAHAVDWTVRRVATAIAAAAARAVAADAARRPQERWILGLLAAQAALLLAVIVFRRSMRFQAVAFFAASERAARPAPPPSNRRSQPPRAHAPLPPSRAHSGGRLQRGAPQRARRRSLALFLAAKLL
jgi:hypothetical protein